ncbi:hypothetical protein FZEAL_8140 [Fusarium zealandicum]|uniref:Uncharacterized protein n=1 Tax=Fusarium zealandicum TaxID=1053134 RepID=A0A8H4UEL2_9HYPO|nr:hypothetical protein FZEAL_8140 [Fusarium zealandicum]
MNYSSISRRAASNTGALGLGWILALSVGGAILLFAAIGFLLTWRIKSQARKNSTTVYQVSENSDDHRRSIFTKRLVKRKHAVPRATSRLSLSLPPVLPPLPTYNSFTFFSGGGKRGRSTSWVEEDTFHGPKMNKNIRDTLFSRDSWLGRVPTLPTLMVDEDPEKGQAEEQLDQAIQVPQRPRLEPRKTAPELPTQKDGIETSPVRAPAQAYIKPWVTDTDLRDILRSTEQRLRHGSATTTPRVSPRKSSPQKRTPQKIPALRSTPNNNSPVKTPHSHKTVSSEDSTGTVRIIRMAPSPSKRTTIHAIPVSGHRRNASITSIGSAANRLIAEATQELVLPGGLSSPSRLKGRQWEPQEKQSPQKKKQSVEKPSDERRHSDESEASSTLSTLYSANDPEEKEQADPFVEKSIPGAPSSENRSSLFGPRSLKSRTTTLSISIPRQQTVFNAPGQLRPSSVSTQAVGGPPLSTMLQPPTEYHQRNSSFHARDQEGIALAFPVTTSMTSIVTPSTGTDDDSTMTLDDRRSESPKPLVPARIRPRPQPLDRNSLATITPTSPSTMASSPFDEQDMLSLLMGTAPPRRALPEPPRHIAHVDRIALPIPLSPRPRRDFAQQLREISAGSSIYDEESMMEGSSPNAISTGSPLRRSLSKSLRDPPSVPPPTMTSERSLGNSILELRRMNSMMSSFSTASVASSYNEPDSPTLPVLGGNVSRARSNSNSVMSTSGRQNYLNLGSPKKNALGSVSSSRSTLGVEIRGDDIKEGKENQGPDVKIPRMEMGSGLRETRRSANLGRDTRDSLNRATSKNRLGTVSELVAESKREAKRQSAESLGLYDKDGFLKNSPDMSGRETKGRCLRM